MTVHELVTAAQNLPFEQWKALIKALFEQLPKTEPLAGSITQRPATWQLLLYTSESWSATRFNAALNSCVPLQAEQ